MQQQTYNKHSLGRPVGLTKLSLLSTALTTTASALQHEGGFHVHYPDSLTHILNPNFALFRWLVTVLCQGHRCSWPQSPGLLDLDTRVRDSRYSADEHNFRIHLSTNNLLTLRKSLHQNGLDQRMILLPARALRSLPGSHDTSPPTAVLPRPSDGPLMGLLLPSLLTEAGPWLTVGRSRDPDLFLCWRIPEPHS